MDSGDCSVSIGLRYSGVFCLCWDHRVFDGSTALMFLNSIKDHLENHTWSEDLN